MLESSKSSLSKRAGQLLAARQLLAGLYEKRDEVSAWCAARDIQLKVVNEGRHWRFLKESVTAEWYPSSFKFVPNRKWKQASNDVQGLDKLYQKLIETFAD